MALEMAAVVWDVRQTRAFQEYSAGTFQAVATSAEVVRMDTPVMELDLVVEGSLAPMECASLGSHAKTPQEESVVARVRPVTRVMEPERVVAELAALMVHVILELVAKNMVEDSSVVLAQLV